MTAMSLGAPSMVSVAPKAPSPSSPLPSRLTTAKAPGDQVVEAMREASRQSRAVADSLRERLAGQRKAQAGETIGRLRQQLLQLMLTAALNPRAFARLIRQMEGQLANAVADYAKAGDGHAADQEFAREARRLHDNLTSLMQATLRRLEDDEEREEEERAFARNASVVEKGLQTIEGWSREPEAPDLPEPQAPVSLEV